MGKHLRNATRSSTGLWAVLLALSVTFFAIPIGWAAGPPDVLRVGMIGEINPLNPNDQIGVSTTLVCNHIYENLVDADESMNILPSLATSWEITRDGGLLFHLRKNVKFHDGTPFTSEAVKMTFDRMKERKLAMGQYFSGLKSVEVIDPLTVKMHVNGSPHVLLSVLTVYGHMESPSAIRKYTNETFGLHPVGTGPFRFVEWVPHQRVVLEGNKEYWRGPPKLSRIVFQPVPEPQTRMSMLEAGDLDVIPSPPIAEIQRLASQRNITVVKEVSGSQINLPFNCVKEPFNDKKVRQAIAFGIDVKGIVNSLLFGQVEFPRTYAAPNMKHVLKYDIYPYNPEKATSLLAELGWKRGKSGFLEKDGKVFRTALLQPYGRYLGDREIGEAIQAQLKKIGIDLKIMNLEFASFLKAVYLKREDKEKAEFGIMMAARPMGPDVDSAFYSNFYSKSSQNKSIYENKELDRLLEEGAKETDQNKRAGIYRKVQDILHEDLPWIPIYFNVDVMAARKGVKNIGDPNPFKSTVATSETQIER